MRISLIIAAHNEGDSLWKTIQSCVLTCAGLDYEIIVSDDASWDDSIARVLQTFPEVRVVTRPRREGSLDADLRQGTSPTKDFGARSATGDVLVFLDGHCKPEPNAIRRLAEAIELCHGKAIITPAIPALDVQSWRSQRSQIGHGYSLDLETFGCHWLPLSKMQQVRRQSHLFYESPAAIGCAFAVHRKLYETIKGFDPDMRSWGVEDLDFSLKCWLMGFQILHEPEAVIAHRFQKRFDRYDVPLVHFVVNQLRMARKNFTQATWAEWVARCRKRQADDLTEHPEGLWAQAWIQFEQDRSTVEQERSYLLGNRPRDEFWFAERFSLNWPKLQSSSSLSLPTGSDAGTSSPGGDDVGATDVGSASSGAGRRFAQTLVVSPSPPPNFPWVPKTPPKTCPPTYDPLAGFSPRPVRYFNGEVSYAVTDLQAPGFGGLWQQRRQYSNQLGQTADLGVGYNWLVETWPYLVQTEEGVSFVQSSHDALWFEEDAGVYLAQLGSNATLSHDADNGLLVLVLPSGEVYRFQDFESISTVFDPAPLYGQLVSHTDASGQTTDVLGYTADGRITAIERQTTVDAVLVSEQFEYSYTEDGQIDVVTWRRQTGTSPWDDIRRVQYEYYDGSDSHGSMGDLMRVSVQVPGDTDWESVEQSYYRYYLTGSAGGFAHGLKYVVEPDGYAAMLADSIDPLTVSGAVLLQYSKYYFEYDTNRRVTQEIVDRGSMTFTFDYETSANDPGFNSWARKTTETRPDGSVNTVYTNSIGQVMLKELSSGSERWVEYSRYDDQAHLIEKAHPSAVLSYNDAAPDLGVTLRSNQGLIELTSYYSTSGGGAAKGYQESTSLKHGQSGTPVLQSRTEYTSRSAGDVTIYPVSKQTMYRDNAGSEPIDTSYAYTWHTGTVQINQQTTTLPAVPTTQNGSGVAATTKQVYDSFGYLTWSMDERGYITHMVYDIPTGGMLRRIDDADTSLLSGVPSGWVTPADGGRHVTTDFELDSQGRTIQQLGPVHTVDLAGTPTAVRRATWTVYRDAQHAVWTGQGYATGSGPNYTYTLINPVTLRQNDPKGKRLAEIQATRSSTAGKLLPTDSFEQSSYTRWTTWQYTDCCFVSSLRVYHTIPASGSGTSGVNYNETTYGYDSLKRRNREVSPGGTITRWVHDLRGNVISTYVGTNDNGATASDPTGGGASGNNMIQLNAMQYDHGDDQGDNNLTQQTQYVDATTTRVTSFAYDWRNRQVDVDGEIDYFQRSYYDNLNRVIKVERLNTTSSGTLVSRDETKFDNRGRVYRTIRWGVDPGSGTVTGQQPQDMTYDQANHRLRQEPAGAMAFQTLAYDSLGRRVETLDPLGNSRLYAYDDANNLISETDPNEEVWTRGYDPLGRLIRSTNPLDESVTYGFNDAGDQTTVSNAMNETTTTTFDAAGRVVSTSDPLGKVTSYAYDANGNQTTVTDPNGLTTESEYDYRDRLVKVTDPEGHETEYTYNRVGEQIVQTDAKGHDTTQAFDALGRMISTTDRLDHTTTFTFNVRGLQASLTDAEDQTTSYIYDDYGRLYQTIWPDHVSGSEPGDEDYGITQSEYDALNRVLRTTDQLGDTVTYNYDDAGRLLSKDYRTAANSPSGTITDSDSFTYDASGRMLTAVSGRYSNTVTYTYDAAGRKTTESLTIAGQTYTSSTQYDAAGRVSLLIYPDGSEVSRGYTARGQLATITLDSTTIDTRAYDNGGRMTSSSYHNGVSESRTYNNDNTVASISFTGAAIGNLGYTWDANLNKTSETIGGVMSGYGFTAGYDDEDRLTSWDRADNTLDQAWNLSPVGDWNSITQNSTVQNRTHGPVHELLTAAGESLTYDAKGNMTLIPLSLRPGSNPLTMSWDFNNKLRGADTDDDGIEDVFYIWDALGRRVGRTANSATTIYFQDGQQTLADYASGATASSPTYIYLFASYIDEVVLRSGGSGLVYYHRNQQYSITALTDASGAIVERYAYTAYGTPTITDASGSTRTTTAIGNRYTYTGREWDETLALYHYRARMYDAVAGRFVGRDSIGYIEGINLYRGYFVMNKVDPEGTCATCCCCPESIEFELRRELKGGDVVNVPSSGDRPVEGQIKAGSYGHEFVINFKFKNVVGIGGACDMKWIEMSTQPIPTVGVKPGEQIDQVKNPATAAFKNFHKDMSDSKCPTAFGNAFVTDIPVTPLKRQTDDRVLCIKLVFSGSCESCQHSKIKYVKQSCTFNNGNPRCTIESSDKDCSFDAGYKEK